MNNFFLPGMIMLDSGSAGGRKSSGYDVIIDPTDPGTGHDTYIDPDGNFWFYDEGSSGPGWYLDGNLDGSFSGEIQPEWIIAD